MTPRRPKVSVPAPAEAEPEAPTAKAEPRIIRETVETRLPGGIVLKAQTQPGSAVNVISGYATTVAMAAGSSLATAVICRMASIAGLWLTVVGLATFVAVAGVGLLLVLRYSSRPPRRRRRR
ncbi:hypothetical protein AB0K09_02505 [Streptomyces sp. NPDC049577]|uniref:hypothetical protein n=1 Tax=Streptomyces sp. NPDC049577 TaxID=3155153 RepID=UPI00342EC163